MSFTRDRQKMADTMADTATALANDLAELYRRLYDAQTGQPGAQRYDTPRAAPQGRLWCDSHQSGDCGCPAVEIIPARSDPAGEAAITPDPARQDETSLEASMRVAARQLDNVALILARYLPRRPTSLERRRALADANAAGCQSCARIVRKGAAFYSPPHTKAPTTANGNLATPMRLCRWCYDYTRDHGHIPSRLHVRQWQENQRVYDRVAQ